MFQSDNDLIPRSAPKPSKSNLDATVFQPAVPEISIVFTQKSSESSTAPRIPVTTSYSVWKDKCLPQVSASQQNVSASPELPTTSKQLSLYPMRAQAIEPFLKCPYSERISSYATNSAETVQLLTSHSSDSKLTQNCRDSASFPSKYIEENKPVICAETQTETLRKGLDELDINNLASKKDIENIKSMLMEIKTEHEHLLKIIKSFQEERHFDKTKPNSKDVGTQIDLESTKDRFNNESSKVKNALTEQNLLKNLDHIESNTSEKQTTKINHNLTLLKTLNEHGIVSRGSFTNRDTQTNIFHPNLVLPKPITEQSMVMNELAAKYLQNGKLCEILEEDFIEKKVKCHNNENVENLYKHPNDFSTASYKYLKKYRLLPEENNNASDNNSLQILKPENRQEHLLDLEMIRCKPKFL